MYIPSWLIILCVFGFFFFVFSLLASWRGISLKKFWSIPVMAVLPWLAVIVMVGIWTTFTSTGSRSQAMAMSGLYPMFGATVVWIIGCLSSFFVSSDHSLNKRIRWSLIISGIPALCLAAFLVYVFLQ